MKRYGYPIFALWLLSANALAKTVLITGSIRGLGKETADHFQAKGWDVWRTTSSDQTDKEKQILALKCNDSQETVDAMLKAIAAISGTIDVVINNAGYGVLGPEELVSAEELMQQLEVNVILPFKVSKAALPIMMKQKQGHIINISSTSGIRALPGLGIYATSKFALEGLSESLAASYAAFGIKVSIVEPGTVKNSWGANCLVKKPEDNSIATELQHKLSTKLQEKLVNLAKGGQEQKEIAEMIYHIAEDPNPKLRYQTSQQAKAVAASVLIDPTGEDMHAKMVDFVEKL